jgi:MGT family glycosyltransferase
VWPFAGHLHPAIAIAHALRARGHSVGFYTGVAFGPIVEGEGFQFFPFEKIDEDRLTVLASSDFSASWSLWRKLRSAKEAQARAREWLLGTIPPQLADLDPVLANWRPDVVICDLSFWSPILVLRESRQSPVAVLSVVAACILPGPDAPNWGRGAPRPRNQLMRLRVRGQRTFFKWLSAGFRRDVNALRRHYGLPALRQSVTEFAGQMPLYLVPSTPEYDYSRRDLPPSVHYVGPCLWDKPNQAPMPEWLAQIRRDQPLIYVTEATIGTTDPFLLKAAARALRDLPVQVVMTTGKQRDPNDLSFEVAAPNIRVESYVPQSDLLPKVSVMVTLGGSGGVLAALKAGVPLVIVPTEWDRPENAQRVVEAGAGLRIDPKQCTPERLRAAVERVLNEPSFRKNAQRLASDFARYGGPARAARLLEDLSSTSTDNCQLRKGVSHGSGY